MKFRILIALLLGGVCMTLLAGCYGHSPITDPTISFSLPEPKEGATIFMPSVTPGSYLITKGTVTPAVEDDVIVKQQWTQQTSVPGAPLGHFFVTDDIQTSWQAPEWTGPGDLPITLTFTVETSLGGHATRIFHVLVVP